MHQAGNHGSLAENEMFFNGIASVVYVSHFTPVVIKASYNMDALDDAGTTLQPLEGHVDCLQKVRQ